MKSLKLTLFALMLGLCTTAFSQNVPRGGIYVSDMVGVEEGTIWGEIPYDLPVKIGQGGGTGGDCPCPKYETYIHWWTNMCSLALGKHSLVKGVNPSVEVAPEEQYATVVGCDAKSFGYGNAVYGHMATADSERATAVGIRAKASGLSSVAMGDGAYAGTGTWSSVSIGCSSKALASNPDWAHCSKPVAVGYAAEAIDGTAVGHHSHATGMYGLAIGGAARATADGAIQIGNGVNNKAWTVQIRDVPFVNVAGEISKHINALETATSTADFQRELLSLLRDMQSGYVFPPEEPVADANEMFVMQMRKGRAADAKDADTEAEGETKFDFNKILNWILGVVVAVLGFFGFKKKTETNEVQTTSKKTAKK